MTDVQEQVQSSKHPGNLQTKVKCWPQFKLKTHLLRWTFLRIPFSRNTMQWFMGFFGDIRQWSQSWDGFSNFKNWTVAKLNTFLLVCDLTTSYQKKRQTCQELLCRSDFEINAWNSNLDSQNKGKVIHLSNNFIISVMYLLLTHVSLNAE